MSRAAQKAKNRFGLAAAKEETGEKVEQVIKAVELVSQRTDPRSETGTNADTPSTVDSTDHPIAENESIAATAHNHFTDQTSQIETTPRIREDIEVSSGFSQKVGVSYLTRFSDLAEKRKAAKTPPFIRRDLLEEALDYLFQKYDG